MTMGRKINIIFAFTAGILSLGLIGIAACSLPLNTANILGSKAIETSPGITIVATSEPEQYLTPNEYMQASQHLAVAVSYLNMAESILLLDLPTAEIPQIDKDLVEFARRANDVAIQAESLADTAAQYVENPSIGIAASQYYSIARLGYALVIQADNFREGLLDGSISRDQAVEMIEPFKAMLWNPKVDELAPGQGTFLPEGSAAYLSPEEVSRVSASWQMKTWLVSAEEIVNLQVNLPGLRQVNDQPGDDNLSQVNTEKSRQIAAANLLFLLSPTGDVSAGTIPEKVNFPVYKSIAITNPADAAAARLPTFRKGNASLLATQAEPESNAIEETADLIMFELDGPSPQSTFHSTPLVDIMPAVTLRITSVKETHIDQGPVFTNIMFDVQLTWKSLYKESILNLTCNQGDTVQITGQDGSRSLRTFTSISPTADQVLIKCIATRPSNFGVFVNPNVMASTSLLITIGQGQGVELIPPIETPTHTPTSTLTPLPTIDSTEVALGTEVAIQKTAEFIDTVTAIAQQTEIATQASTITMNGTFGISKEPDTSCMVGTYFSGTIRITANFGTGSASGILTGGGGRTYPGVICGNLKYDVTCTESWTGNFSGPLDTTSGAVNLGGSVSGSQNCNASNCTMDGNETSCPPFFPDNKDRQITITGVILKDSGTGHGTLQTCSGCTGDWSAGK
jgi:hypothetical protein